MLLFTIFCLKYMFIIFIYEWQSVGWYGIPAIPTLPCITTQVLLKFHSKRWHNIFVSDIPFYWTVFGLNIFKRSVFRSDYGFFGRILIKPTVCSLSISTSTQFCLSVFLHLILLIVCRHSATVVLPSYWQEAHPSDIRIYYLAWHLHHLRFVRIAVSSGVISPYPTLLSWCKKEVDACFRYMVH